VTAFVSLDGVRKQWSHTVTIGPVSLEIARGEIVALLGPSGSGKTTVLRLLAGFELPDAGRLAIAGEDVTALPPARRRCGMVFQHYALFPHLDVGDNVGFGLDRLDREGRDRKIAASLELVDLAGFERRKPHELSGGQLRRVVLARILAMAAFRIAKVGSAICRPQNRYDQARHGLYRHHIHGDMLVLPRLVLTRFQG